MESLVSRTQAAFSNFQSRIRVAFEEYPVIAHLWCGIFILSILVAVVSTTISTSDSRRDVVRPLLIGVITLFTIILTVTIMGIRLASSRYSHRVDASVIQRLPFVIHFSPHLLAMLAGILILANAEYTAPMFVAFIVLSSISILSVFPFLQWLLQSLSPGQVLGTSIQAIDSGFLDQVEQAVADVRTDIHENSPGDVNGIYQKVSYLHLSEDDPVDAFSDILRSRIQNGDTWTAKRLLHDYVEHVEPLIANRYYKFLVSHSDSQLVCWYLYSPLEQMFRVAVKEDNHIIAMEIILLLSDSIKSWVERYNRGVPEVFPRIFGDITTDFAPECDRGQRKSIASEYSKIARLIASDINAPPADFNGAVTHSFIDYSLAFALSAIDNEDYRSARITNQGLRFIVEARLRYPSGNPERVLLAIGLIGERFATEEAKSKEIVEIANEVSVMDEAEWSIIMLVTFKDKIEEYGNDFTSNDAYLERVLSEVRRINRALEERDREIASETDLNENLVLRMMRASRFFRSSFTPDELLLELDDSRVSIDTVRDVCDELVSVGAMTRDEDGKYNTAFDEF